MPQSVWCAVEEMAAAVVVGDCLQHSLQGYLIRFLAVDSGILCETTSQRKVVLFELLRNPRRGRGDRVTVHNEIKHQQAPEVPTGQRGGQRIHLKRNTFELTFGKLSYEQWFGGGSCSYNRHLYLLVEESIVHLWTFIFDVYLNMYMYICIYIYIHL